MKKGNESEIQVDFDYIFKADYYILSIISRKDGMIDWNWRNIILKEVNIALKYFKP